MASRYTHAGGVVFREGPSGPEYLIVEARRSPGTWVLPKGHIEDGETAEQAAVREVQEEAGSDALVLGRIGSIEFGTVRVAFFLMRHRRDVPSDERRRLKWCTCEEAQRRVSFEDIRQLLQKAHVRVSKGAKGTKVAKVPGNVRARGA